MVCCGTTYAAGSAMRASHCVPEASIWTMGTDAKSSVLLPGLSTHQKSAGSPDGAEGRLAVDEEGMAVGQCLDFPTLILACVNAVNRRTCGC
jgi:hypothetical protein